MRLGLGLGVNKGRKNSGVAQDAVITALIDQATTDGYTPFSGDTLTAANTFATTLRSLGVLSKLDVLYVLATNGDESFSKYNWINPAAFYATETGAGALTFTTNQGIASDGVNYLNTQYNASTSSTNFTQDAASYGFYTRTNNNVRGQMGTEGSVVNLARARFSTTSTFRINSAANLDFVTTNVDGFWHLNRDSSTSIDVFYDGSIVANSDANTSAALPNANFNVLKDSVLVTTQQIAIAFIGGDLSAEAADLYTAVQTYMTAIGSAV